MRRPLISTPGLGRRLVLGPLSLDLFHSMTLCPVLMQGRRDLAAARLRLHAAIRWRGRTVLLLTSDPRA